MPGPPADDSPSRGDLPLYRQLAERLTLAIQQGALRPGTRLPSVRQAAREQLVSVSTVVQAYRWLEDARLVQARPRSGHVVLARSLAALPEPATSAPQPLPQEVDVFDLSEHVMEMAATPGVISFGAVCPHPELFAQDRLRRALSQATLRQRQLITRYPTGHGEQALRSAIARRALALGCALDPRRIVITNGTNEAVTMCLLAVTRPGDTVALESPTSFGFLQILQSLQLKALEIPTHPRHGLSVDALALALQTQPVRAVLAVPTLQNPLGACMPLAERRRLAALLAEHRVPLIEDAIYNDLAERDEYRRAVKSFDPEGWVMLAASFSKTVAPGLRVGWAEGGRFGDALRRRKMACSGGHTGVVEMAMAELLTQPGYEPQLRRLRQVFAQRLAEARQLIGQHFPRGTRVTDPAGGLMLWLELPSGVDAMQLFRDCQAEGICIAPGPMFSAGPRYRHCVRLSVGQGWTLPHQQAMARVGWLAQRLHAQHDRHADTAAVTTATPATSMP
ncbi:aminotransferase-like domain-containing protein [Aquabacterium sp. OR-4]|uniref:aminotransferase-like domain-containing protein n=1 Tax=Aquabacterium sp. OR-4 TaxID=2978127 RepID=UPI0021B1E10E|nr:PLP-dependent aminotransferase family protein [Aquabacterium sp. OR-4]MDT7835573.1 PLP-dependent aminotransferase family protein [Aquabacterium sp. OR-4]